MMKQATTIYLVLGFILRSTAKISYLNPTALMSSYYLVLPSVKAYAYQNLVKKLDYRKSAALAFGEVASKFPK